MITKARNSKHHLPAPTKPPLAGADSVRLAEAIVEAANRLGTGDRYGPGAIEYLAVRVSDGLAELARAVERLADAVEGRS